MTKKELIKSLLKGKKMTSDEFATPDKTYCMYDASHSNPFRFIGRYGTSESMGGAWSLTDWREVKSSTLEPQDGEKWFYVDHDGSVSTGKRWLFDEDFDVVRQGRVFKTKEDAEAFSKWEQAAFRLKKCIFELNDNKYKGFIKGKDNYMITYDTQCKELLVRKVYFEKSQPSWFYLNSKEEAEQLINDIEEDLITYFEY